MNEKIIVGGVYRHFKGDNKIYRVIRIARDCDNPEREIVVYEQLYKDEKFPRGTLWVRILEDFLGDKIFEDGRKVKRFELVSRE
jgi:hypothetical protein